MIGKRLTHYEIIEKLGEGGMGVVYKARDTHLDRFVAIKVLPAERVADAERKRRFILEAKAASALNHPNIVTVHDITEVGCVTLMVMEYIEGKTLDQLIGRKALKLNDVLTYSVQLAGALAKAHAAGIVHRDLKPANIMVTRDGIVKLLDFGLAKLTEPAPCGSEASTWTMRPLTEEGVIVGTVAYMSPEQAEGKPVDARSDIFAFGSVLYEMIAGRRAFQGDSKMAIVSAILHRDPKPISTIAGETPPELEKLISRCLRKDTERRTQHMADVKLALEDLKAESESGKLVSGRAAPPHHWLLLALVVGLLIAAATGVFTWRLTRPPSVVPAPALSRLTSDSGLTTDPALSPDGKLLAYASDRGGDGNLDIYVRQVGGGEPIRLTRDPADDYEPTFSPDGTQIAFRSTRQGGGIYVVSALGGGAARRIAPEGQRPRFSPDGNWIAYHVFGVGGSYFAARERCRLYVVASAGGPPMRLRSDFVAAAYPVWAPDGKHLLFLGNRDEKLPPEDSVDWWVTSLDSGPVIKTGALDATRRERLSGSVVDIYSWALAASTWLPERDSLIFSARSGDSTNLWRLGISPKTWKIDGPPQRLTFGATLEENPSAASGPGGTARVAFASLSEDVNIFSLSIEANQGKVTGVPEQLTQDSAVDFHPSLSPDGRRIAFISARTGGDQVWIKDLGSGEEFAVTASRSAKWLPLFSRDGSKLSFSSYENEKWNTYVMPAAGGVPEMICGDCGEIMDWSPDGKRVIGNTVSGRVWLVEVASRQKTELFGPSGWWMAPGSFSPDGRWIPMVEGRSLQTYVAPFQGTSIAETAWIPIGDGFLLRWSPDGSYLYGYSGRDGFLCLWAQRLDRITKRPEGAPIPVFHSHGARRSLANQSDLKLFVGRQRIVFSMGDRTGNIWMAELR